MRRILIADDHAVVRGGLKQFLSDTPDMMISGEAATAREAMAMVREGEWDLLLLDITLPDASGLDLLKRIKREKPQLPILVFSMFSEDEYAITALNAGASGYLAKDSPRIRSWRRSAGSPEAAATSVPPWPRSCWPGPSRRPGSCLTSGFRRGSSKCCSPSAGGFH
ncbi:MAG: response regulator transcription factor [Comamonadaceae bacterium]|nr:response regulator transcription factor [Comamonadaceae bacterium]